MEVGIEDCLHIEFEYDKSKYHLKDTVVGKIYFLLARPRRSSCMHCICMPCVCRPCYNGLPAIAGTPCARIVCLNRRQTRGAAQVRIAHGDRDTAAGDDRRGLGGAQRERDAGQVRDHGRRARARREHPHPVRPGAAARRGAARPARMRRPAQTAPFVSARVALGLACRCTRSADAPAAHFDPNTYGPGCSWRRTT